MTALHLISLISFSFLCWNAAAGDVGGRRGVALQHLAVSLCRRGWEKGGITPTAPQPVDLLFSRDSPAPPYRSRRQAAGAETRLWRRWRTWRGSLAMQGRNAS